MTSTQLNAGRLTQGELIEFVRSLIDSAKNKLEINLEDSIALKYLETLEKDANELESTNLAVLSDEKNQQLQELDRIRDKYLLIFRRLMQVYELSDDNSPEAVAYEKLNDWWMKKYDTLQYLNFAVETTGIDNMLFDLSANEYAGYIDTLKLDEALDNVKISNDKFKIIYGEITDHAVVKPIYDARALRIELTETVVLYINYVKAMADSSENKEMKQLYKGIKDTYQAFRKQIGERHSGITLADDEII